MRTAVLVGGFLIAGYAGRQFPDVLNGSLIYAPAFLLAIGAPAFLLAIGTGVYHCRTQSYERFGLPIAVGVFAVAVLFRTTDEAVCLSIPIGTHFLWHVLTGLALYLFARGLLVNIPERHEAV